MTSALARFVVATATPGTRTLPIPIIIDCDPGTDDAIALLLGFASPELDIRAVTVAGGNVGLSRTLANALALTGFAGATVPVHAGADRPLLGRFTDAGYVHGNDGLGGIVLPAGGMPSPEHAIDAIRRILRDAADPVTLVGIGPATNLALALATEPALIRNVARIVLMTGAWAEGNITPAAEFNAYSDPEALQILLDSTCPVVLVTLELTAQALVTPARLAAWRGLGAGRCLVAACDILSRVPPSRRLGLAGSLLHDPCTIAWLLRPDLFTTRPCAARVDLGPGPSRGRTVIDRWGTTGEAPNATLLETLDADAFFGFVGGRLSLLP